MGKVWHDKRRITNVQKVRRFVLWPHVIRGGAAMPDSDRTGVRLGLESETLRTGIRNRITTPDSGLGMIPRASDRTRTHNSGLRTGVRNRITTPDSGLESETKSLQSGVVIS